MTELCCEPTESLSRLWAPVKTSGKCVGEQLQRWGVCTSICRCRWGTLGMERVAAWGAQICLCDTLEYSTHTCNRTHPVRPHAGDGGHVHGNNSHLSLWTHSHTPSTLLPIHLTAASQNLESRWKLEFTDIQDSFSPDSVSVRQEHRLSVMMEAYSVQSAVPHFAVVSLACTDMLTTLFLKVLSCNASSELPVLQ